MKQLKKSDQPTTKLDPTAVETEPVKKLKAKTLEIKQKGVKPGELDESLTPVAIPIPEEF
jgi:hypothetical protein